MEEIVNEIERLLEFGIANRLHLCPFFTWAFWDGNEYDCGCKLKYHAVDFHKKKRNMVVVCSLQELTDYCFKYQTFNPDCDECEEFINCEGAITEFVFEQPPINCPLLEQSYTEWERMTE